MNDVTCTRRFQFCCGHRVLGHENKCALLHGHNYVLFVTAKPKQGLDDLGRVIDFGVMKQLLGKWIDEYWDHRFVLFCKDEEAIDAVKKVNGTVFQLPENPTAENMARYLLYTVCPGVFAGKDIEAVRAVLWETENCCAEVSL